MKFIAALCMLMDHIGLVFYPDDIRWRIIGRLAMPIFAYGVARGAFYTTSLRKYLKKMLLFSFVAQVPFWGMKYMALGGAFFSLRLNIGFTFLLALIAIALLQRGGITPNTREKLREVTVKTQILTIASAIGCVMMAEFLNCDYGSYGVLLVVIGYFMFYEVHHLLKIVGIYILLTVLFYNHNWSVCLLQSIGVLGYGVIYATRHLSEKQFGRFFYCFYPLHMFIIGMIKWCEIKG